MKPHAQRIVRISRVVADLARAQAFYRDTLGFETVARGPSDQAALSALGGGEAEETVMRLGAATVALVRFATPGRAYPQDSQSNDLWFQHLAIVVGDMDAAYAHLAAGGCRPISQQGPQLLPPSAGGVKAFKFRDPDGHPLELLWFPAGAHEPLFQTVDHSALAVSSTPRSLAFYATIGMRVSHQSLNHGPAQDSLDGLPQAHAEVTGLRPSSNSGPGLELLGYRPPGRPAAATKLNDTVTDWVTIEVATLFGEVRRAVRDPDGHRFLLIDQGTVISD